MEDTATTVSVPSDPSELRRFAEATLRQKQEADRSLDQISLLWDKAFQEFGDLRVALEAERIAHAALSKASAARQEEYNELKRKYDALVGGNSSAAAAQDQASNVYLIPTLSALGGGSDGAKVQLAKMEVRARNAESQVERLTSAAQAALEEFQTLRKRFTEETLLRQEAEKMAAELSSRLEHSGTKESATASLNPSAELMKERKLRELAQAEVDRLSVEVRQQQGNRFDLMTVTELECKLENSNRALHAAEERYEQLTQRLEATEAELGGYKRRMGDQGSGGPPAPPPPPVPSIFNAVDPSEALKSRLNDLKKKLQRPGESDLEPLSDLRAQAMNELAEKLKKRKQGMAGNATTPVSPPPSDRMDKLATVLSSSKSAASGSSTENDDPFMLLERQFAELRK